MRLQVEFKYTVTQRRRALIPRILLLNLAV